MIVIFTQLEAFLIANREEYLRHSALNYTVQQKQYNNRLTERLLELAAEHGYVFDADAFSFVTVRDRIRCYFKVNSWVIALFFCYFPSLMFVLYSLMCNQPRRGVSSLATRLARLDS